ncbi:MAG: hypothetical protein KC505_09490, partial [Myxococcales bacterium]|nr:hypothetical protein [Myxococcales bacterium]
YLGAEISVNQAVAPGAISSRFGESRSLTSDLLLKPTLKSKEFWGDRYLKADLEFYSIFEWMPKNTAKAGEKLSFNDVKFRTQLKNAVNHQASGISYAPGVEVEIPASKTSSVSNRIIGLGLNSALSWSKWGLTLSYKPTAVAYIHSLPYKSSACSPDSSAEDKLSGNQCRVDGRQTMLMLKNQLSAEYTLGANVFTLAFKTYHNFLRPNEEAQKYTESTLAYLEYGYKLPTSFETILKLGITSYNPAYDPANGFKVPFVSTNVGASNFTNIYAGVDITL